jgi:hypothetical protein
MIPHSRRGRTLKYQEQQKDDQRWTGVEMGFHVG